MKWSEVRRRLSTYTLIVYQVLKHFHFSRNFNTVNRAKAFRLQIISNVVNRGTKLENLIRLANEHQELRGKAKKIKVKKWTNSKQHTNRYDWCSKESQTDKEKHILRFIHYGNTISSHLNFIQSSSNTALDPSLTKLKNTRCGQYYFVNSRAVVRKHKRLKKKTNSTYSFPRLQIIFIFSRNKRRRKKRPSTSSNYVLKIVWELFFPCSIWKSLKRWEIIFHHINVKNSNSTKKMNVYLIGTVFSQRKTKLFCNFVYIIWNAKISYFCPLIFIFTICLPFDIVRVRVFLSLSLSVPYLLNILL